MNLHKRSFAGAKIAYAPAPPYGLYSLGDAETEQGNMVVIDGAWLPSANEAFIDSALIPFMVSQSVGRQSLLYSEYDRITHNWVPVAGGGILAQVFVDNAVPVSVGTIPNQVAFTNIFWESPILDLYVTDADADQLTFSLNSGTLPTGVTLQSVTINAGLPDQRVVRRFRGTPSSGQQGSYSLSVRATDIVGDFVNLMSFTLTVGVGQLMPVVDTGSTSLNAALAAIQASLPTSSITYRLELSPTAPGNVAQASPEGGTYVPPGTPVALIVSAVQIPSFLGMSEQNATLQLLALGFTVTRIAVNSPEYSGLVAGLTDGAGTPLQSGELVLYGIPVILAVDEQNAEYTTVAILVRAFKRGFFGGYLREVGDTFSITTPYQFTPYWMTMIGMPPADWLPYLEGYSDEVARRIITIPTAPEALEWTESGEHP